jgi:hypothetical protein
MYQVFYVMIRLSRHGYLDRKEYYEQHGRHRNEAEANT